MKFQRLIENIPNPNASEENKKTWRDTVFIDIDVKVAEAKGPKGRPR